MRFCFVLMVIRIIIILLCIPDKLSSQPEFISYKGQNFHLDKIEGKVGFEMLMPLGKVQHIVDNPHRYKGYIKLGKNTSLCLEVTNGPSTLDLKNVSEIKATLNGLMHIEYAEESPDAFFYKVYIDNNCDLFYAKEKNDSNGYFSARLKGKCRDFQALNAGEVLLKSLTSIN